MMVTAAMLSFLKGNHENGITILNLYSKKPKNRYNRNLKIEALLYLFCAFVSKRLKFLILNRNFGAKRITAQSFPTPGDKIFLKN